jgi:phosphoglycerate kinase
MLIKKTIKDMDVKDKKVFVRVDFNVPLADSEITDDTRIIAALPTINYLLENEAAVILASHLGRPGGEVKKELSLAPIAEYLMQLINANIYFVDDCLGNKVREAVESLNIGEVLVLENTRFHAGEKNNDPDMGMELAALADVFINDAFGTAHRAHASNVGISDHLPSAAGFLLEKEITYLDKTIKDPGRPFIAILGGAKVSGKIGVINNLIGSVDSILIGGGMANTFFAAKGYQLGDSLIEDDSIPVAKDLLKKAGNKLILPTDVVISDQFADEAKYKTIMIGDVPSGWRIMDIGEGTLKLFSEKISQCKTLVWNGPMGVFEFPNFAKGTFGLARTIANADIVSIIGGGDSAAAVVQAGLSNQITHISTGGGASLQMLEGKPLPGLEALDDK